MLWGAVCLFFLAGPIVLNREIHEKRETSFPLAACLDLPMFVPDFFNYVEQVENQAKIARNGGLAGSSNTLKCEHRTDKIPPG
jgi:hypothetical protein